MSYTLERYYSDTQKSNKKGDTELEILFRSTVDNDWVSLLESQFKKEYFIKLNKFLEKEKENKEMIYPPENQIFRVFQMCSLDKIRVVIIGQDPYPSVGNACGLSFSVSGISRDLPPSLKNIFKELASDLKNTKFMSNSNGDLSKWVENGVFLLNTVLTVKKNKIKSHSDKGWEEFTNFVIKVINKKRENVVFVLWGNDAKKKDRMINTKKHYIITSSHPSYLSAHKGVNPFFGSVVFTHINILLKKNPIPWDVILN